MLRLTLNLADNTLIPGLNQRGQVGTAAKPLASIAGTQSKVQLQCVDVNPSTGLQEAVLLPSGTTLDWGLKIVGRFEDDWVVRIPSFTTPGDASGYYEGVLDCDVDEVHEALRTPNANLEDDLPSITVAGEINIRRPGTTKPDKTAYAICVTIANCYTQGTEGVPRSANPSIGARVGSLFYLAGVTSYTGGTIQCLDGLATVDLPLPQLALFRIAGAGLRFYQLTAGTDAAELTDFTVIRPVDFNASTNAKVWTSVA